MRRAQVFVLVAALLSSLLLAVALIITMVRVDHRLDRLETPTTVGECAVVQVRGEDQTCR